MRVGVLPDLSPKCLRRIYELPQILWPQVRVVGARAPLAAMACCGVNLSLRHSSSLVPRVDRVAQRVRRANADHFRTHLGFTKFLPRRQPYGLAIFVVGLPRNLKTRVRHLRRDKTSFECQRNRSQQLY